MKLPTCLLTVVVGFALVVPSLSACGLFHHHRGWAPVYAPMPVYAAMPVYVAPAPVYSCGYDSGYGSGYTWSTNNGCHSACQTTSVYGVPSACEAAPACPIAPACEATPVCEAAIPIESVEPGPVYESIPTQSECECEGGDSGAVTYEYLPTEPADESDEPDESTPADEEMTPADEESANHAPFDPYHYSFHGSITDAEPIAYHYQRSNGFCLQNSELRNWLPDVSRPVAACSSVIPRVKYSTLGRISGEFYEPDRQTVSAR